MFFLIDFSYKQGLGIYTRLLSSVIPACAGMTAEVSAKLLLPFSDGLLPCPYYGFSAVGRILESDISNSGFSETTDASNVFVGYKYPTYI